MRSPCRYLAVEAASGNNGRMNHRILVLAISVSTLGFGLVRCSSGDNTTDGGSDASNDTTNQSDTSTKDGSSTDSSTNDSSTNDGASGVQLKVKNYFSWCSVSVNGGSASASAVQTVNVTPGTIPLSATALQGFILGDWHHTTGDTGSGDPGTVDGGVSSTSIVVGDAAACAWVCCPFPDGGGCPTGDQCP